VSYREKKSMARSRLLVAVVLLGVIWASTDLAAQWKQQAKGLAVIKSGDYEQAIAIFKELALNGKAKEQFYNYYQLGNSYYLNGQYPEAIAAINESLKHTATAPSGIVNSMLHRCYDWLGAAYYQNGSYPEAVTSYKKAIELDPKNGQYYSWLGRSLIHVKQYGDALAAAKRGNELQPGFYADMVLGELHAARKQFDEAIAAYRRAIENNPKRLDLHLQLGQAFLAKNDYDGAIGAYTKAAELAPNDPGLPYGLGVIYSRAGKFDEAVAALDKAVGMVTFVGIGIETGIENGQLVLKRLIEGPAKEAGLEAGDRLVKIDGQSTKGWDLKKTSQSLRGEENTQVVLRIQRQGEAKPFEKTITRKLIIPKAAALYYGFRSLCAREKGNREGAVKDAGLAYSLDPDNVDAREALAAVSLDGGKYEEAIKLLSPLKDNPFARILEATAFAKQGDVKRAVEIYADIPEEELLADRVMRQNARKALLQTLGGYVQERLDQARASESAGRFLEALAEYAEALKIADDTTAGLIRQRVAITLKSNPYLTELPEEARKYALRGDVLIKEGGFAGALAEYRTALKIAPFNAQLHFNEALIHGQLKDYREAIKSMNVYLQLNPDAPNARAAKDEIYKWEFSLEKEGKK
jgi:tetratricopeptide (TPR) repeat protein